MKWKSRDVISILDFTREDLETLFHEALEIERRPEKYSRALEGKLVGLAFFEPSTRTYLSFDAAVKRMGGNTIGFTQETSTSIAKGESFADTVRTLDLYVDCLVIRHPLEGSSRFASEIARSPVINAGDGSQHHPTQTFVDFYALWRRFGYISGLVIGVLGDLRYSRAASSFILGLTLYRPRKLYLISPPLLRLREEVRAYLAASGLAFEEIDRLEDVMHELDVLYVTRVQRERFPDPGEYEKVRGSYRVDGRVLAKAKAEAVLMHPLPRVEELTYEVDRAPQAYYFKQASYGVPVRMALLKLVLLGESS
ncbi:MAG: aspartate carbamoyltransferase [Fervidicoccaceae archaeon]